MTCLRFLSTLSTSAINSSLSRSMSDSQPSQWKLLILLIHLIGSLTLLLHLAQVTVIRWSPIGSLVMGYHEYKSPTFRLQWSAGGVYSWSCNAKKGFLVDLISTQYNNLASGDLCLSWRYTLEGNTTGDWGHFCFGGK